MKKIIFILGLLLIFPIISAGGLTITGTEISVNKTSGIDSNIELNIINEALYSFYNITFKENWIELPKFTLNAGENITIIAKITKDEDFNGQINLIGDYYSDIGASNITQDVEVDYANLRLSPCNLNLVVGDSINWKNLHYSPIKLMNQNTGIEIVTIQTNSSLKQLYTSPINFNYYAIWMGFQFTQICNVNVMNSQGYVHNSEYDGLINLNLKILYDPTTIESTFYEDYYEINYNKEIEDVLRLKNTGTKIAKNIHLSGEWFEFGNNDFDLNAGSSINIPYTINPYIINTNDTDKNYTKKITITGNFDTIEKNFTIFIPYSKVTSIFSGNVDESVIIEFFKYFCKEDEETCIDLFCSIYPETCEGIFQDSNITQSFSGSTIKELIEGYAKLLAENEQSKKTQIESDTTQTNEIIHLNSQLNQSNSQWNSIEEKVDNLATAGIFFIIVIAFFGCLGLLYVIYKKEVSFNSLKKKLGFHRGENV